MNIEKRSILAEFRIENESNKIAGYGAVFNSLSENLGGFRETIQAGAFDGVLNNDVRALIDHNSSLILGRTTSNTLVLSVDEVGLRYEVELPDTSYAKDLRASIARGDITQSSFAFTVDDDKWSEDEDGRVIRTIKKIGRLFDVSPVTYPAYPDATVALRSLNSLRKTSHEIETEMRKRTFILMGINRY